ncbi:unnamed protein product [Durusdinium trenchii]
MPHEKKMMRLDKSQRLILKHADAGQRLDMILPHIIKKFEKISDPEATKLVVLLQQQCSQATAEVSGAWLKKLRQVQIHRSLERMNASALLDLLSGYVQEDIFHALHKLRQNHFISPCQETFDSFFDGRITVFSL